MAGRIPEHFIDELMARTDIVEVIEQRVALRKAGREYKACCPFHDEKTPSFTVSAEKQFYHCFGCGAHGTALGFLIDYDHLEFPEAVEELARRAGLEVPRETGGADPADDRAPLYEVLEAANRFYQRQLREHPDAPRAVDYLKGRGVSGEIAAAYDIGFAPDRWDALVQGLGDTEARRRLLAQAGLTAERDSGGAYDRLRSRIVFPIHDRRGRVVGFGGRILGAGEPKYLNSPETPVFQKGRELYGFHQVRTRNRRLERILVVEGYMDVVALAQHGIGYAVATLGTAATAEHAERLLRAAPLVVFGFDGDEAGRRAAWRALENVLPGLRPGRDVRFLFLPEGEDPDSLVRGEGAGAFEARIDAAVPLGEYLKQRLTSQVDMDTADGQARLAELAAPLLGRMPEGSLANKLYREFEALTGLPRDEWSTLSRGGERAPATRGTPRRTARRRGPESRVRRAIKHLLHHPRLATAAPELGGLREVALPGVPLLVELLEMLHRNPDMSTAAVVERFRDHEHGRHLARLAAETLEIALSAGLEREFRDTIDGIAREAREQRFQALHEKAHRGSLEPEEKREYAALTRQFAAPRPPSGRPS